MPVSTWFHRITTLNYRMALRYMPHSLLTLLRSVQNCQRRGPSAAVATGTHHAVEVDSVIQDCPLLLLFLKQHSVQRSKYTEAPRLTSISDCFRSFVIYLLSGSFRLCCCWRWCRGPDPPPLRPSAPPDEACWLPLLAVPFVPGCCLTLLEESAGVATLPALPGLGTRWVCWGCCKELSDADGTSACNKNDITTSTSGIGPVHTSVIHMTPLE